MVDRVYDPVRGIVPASPQQSWIDYILSQAGNALSGGGNALANEQSRRRMLQAQQQAGWQPPDGTMLVPPPWASGASDLPPDPITPVPPAGGVLPPLDRDQGLGALAPGQPGSTLAGPPAPASAMLGGNDYAARGLGPTGAVAGSSAQYPDETGRGISSPAASVATGGLANALGGLGGPTPLNRSAAEALYEDESGLALRQGFKDAGIDSFTNPYAQRAIKRFAPIMGDLMDFFALASGINPGDTASMATWVPAFIKGFMSGEIDPDKMVRRAIELAEQSRILKTFLVEQIGPERLLAIQGQTSGYGKRVESARQSVIKERLARQQMAELQNPVQGNEEAWLQIVRGGGR